MVLICLIVIAALAVCMMSAWRRAGAAPSPAARPAERRPAEVIEEGFSSESIAYGRSVMDHPMLEREAAKLCEKIKTDLQNGEEIFYEIYGGRFSIYYVQDNIGCSAPLEDRSTQYTITTMRFHLRSRGLSRDMTRSLVLSGRCSTWHWRSSGGRSSAIRYNVTLFINSSPIKARKQSNQT